MMYTYLVRKRVACVEIHRLMYPYLVRKRAAREERIAIYNNYLPRSKANVRNRVTQAQRKAIYIPFVVLACWPSRIVRLYSGTLPRSETPTNDYSSVFIDYNSFVVACFAIEIKETN